MKNNVVISKMIGYADKVSDYSKNMTYDDFMKNEMVMEACVFNLSQLGELVNKIDEDYRTEHPEIAWNQIYGLRNRIVHDYEGVNLNLVWEIIQDDLPILKKQLEACQTKETL